MKASEYMPGDEVVLVKKYSFKNGMGGGISMKIGTKGVIQALEIQVSQHIKNNIVAVEYEGDNGAWFTDADCIELTHPLVTEAELAEVYESLGVSHVAQE